MDKIAQAIKIAVSNLGEEELEQLRHTVITRADTQAEADALFGKAPEAREADRKETDKLFVQGKVSRHSNTSTMARDVHKTAAIDAYIEKTAGIYLRYPELAKVACGTATPKLIVKPKTTGTTGPTPAQASLSGGAA